MNEIIDCPNCSTRLTVFEDHCPNCRQAFCPECNSPVSREANYCPDCGSEMEPRCPSCGRVVVTGSRICGGCGYLLKNSGTTIVPEYTRIHLNDESAPENDSLEAIKCPSCGEALFLDDGICTACDQLICMKCGNMVSDDDERCVVCGLLIYFDCPLCDFELTSSATVCPNCNALFPTDCPYCNVDLEPGLVQCQKCHQSIDIQQRHSARTIRSFIVGDRLVRMVACPNCGRTLDPAVSECSRCQTAICPECLLILQEHEATCVKCGWVRTF